MLNLVIFAFIFAILVLCVVRTPAMAIVGVWCMFGVEQWMQASNIFFVHHRAFVNIAMGILVVCSVVISLYKNRRISLNSHIVAWLVVLLFSYALISTTWAPRIDLSYGVWESSWPYVFTLIILVQFSITEMDDFIPVFNMLLFVGGIIVCFLLFGVEWEHRRIVLMGGHISSPNLGNPLTVAELAGYVIFVVVLLNRTKTNIILNCAKWILACICIALIIRSGSRGQLIGVFLVLVLMLPFAYNIFKIRNSIAISFVLIIFVAICSWAFNEYWAGSNRWAVDSMKSSMGGRLDQSFFLLGHWLAHPMTFFFGLGNSASYDPKIIGIYPHFVPFEVLAEEGIVGFGLYIIMLFYLAKKSCQSYCSLKKIETRRIFVVLCAMTIYSFMLSLKQGSLLGNVNFFMMAVVLGKCNTLIYLDNKQQTIGRDANLDTTAKISTP